MISMQPCVCKSKGNDIMHLEKWAAIVKNDAIVYIADTVATFPIVDIAVTIECWHW